MLSANCFLAHLSRRTRHPSVRSSPEPLYGLRWNFVGMKYSRSPTGVVVFQPDPPRCGSRAWHKYVTGGPLLQRTSSSDLTATAIMWINKSPKGHWSLTWVQWALLLKVKFLSKSESMTAIFVKSVRTATMAIFQFRIRRCIRFVAVAFRSEEEVLWRKGPSLTYLIRHLSYKHPESM